MGSLLLIAVLAVALGAVAGWFSSLQNTASRFWAAHPWKVFWFSYLYIIPMALTYTVLPLTSIVLTAPGLFVTYSSGVQGLRVSWERSKLNATLLVSLVFCGLVINEISRASRNGDFRSLDASLIGNIGLIFIWVLSVYVARKVGVHCGKTTVAHSEINGSASPHSQELVQCKSCRTKNSVNRLSCLACGNSLAEIETIDLTKSEAIQQTAPDAPPNLDQKWWYRLCKLFYGFSYATAILLVFLLSYRDLHTEYIDSDKSIISCANGKSLPAGINSLYPTSNQLAPWEDFKARDLCLRSAERIIVDSKNGERYEVELSAPQGSHPELIASEVVDKLKKEYGASLDIFDRLALERKLTEYTFIPVKRTKTNYAPLVWGLAIVFLIGELIRRSFLYVLAGIPFFGIRTDLIRQFRNKDSTAL